MARLPRRDHLPYGFDGGHVGSPSTSVLHHPDGSEEVLPVMVSTRMTSGERIYHRQPGAGGHGDPMARDPGAVALDVRNDRVSVEAARALYGVVVEPDTFEVNEAATNKLCA